MNCILKNPFLQSLFYQVDLPLTWDKQAEGKLAQLVDLQPSSNEYKEMSKLFNHSIDGGYEVTKIERIQNPALYKAYMVKKQSMIGRENEKRLFHGTDVKNIEAINVNNFSRSYSGINGKFSSCHSFLSAVEQTSVSGVNP